MMVVQIMMMMVASRTVTTFQGWGRGAETVEGRR